MVSSKHSLSRLTQPGQYFEYGSAIALNYVRPFPSRAGGRSATERALPGFQRWRR
jgi:hypothetical protein